MASRPIEASFGQVERFKSTNGAASRIASGQRRTYSIQDRCSSDADWSEEAFCTREAESDWSERRGQERRDEVRPVRSWGLARLVESGEG